MPNHFFYFVWNDLSVLLGLAAAFLILRAEDRKTYWPAVVLVLWEAIPYAALLTVRQLGQTHLTPQRAYDIYFNIFWSSYLCQAVAGVLLTYYLFSVAMRPLKGLHELGVIMYFWAGIVSTCIALATILEPQPKNLLTISVVVNQFQKSSSILTLSLMVFVCLAIRPMGLSFRSRVVGSGIAVCVTSLLTLLQANYILFSRRLFGTPSVISTAAKCVADVIWIWYFSRPEPKRKFVLLPTTSPFHQWNRISEMLGQEPGYVAIAGIPPEALAEAEIEIFHRASVKMTAQERFDAVFKEEQASLLPK